MKLLKIRMDLHSTLFSPSSRVKAYSNKTKTRDPMTTVNQGFTLIEILIVIVIISIVSGIAALTISRNQQKQYESLANRLSHLITLAEEEAMLRPATLGLAFTPESFQFFEYQNKATENKTHWQAQTDKLYGLHSFSPNIKLTVKVQNKTVALDGQPHIIISASGDIVPFTIWIGKEDEPPSYQVTGYANGNVTSWVFHEK